MSRGKTELPVLLLEEDLKGPLIAVLNHTLLTKIGPDIRCDDIVWLMALAEGTAKVTRAVALETQGHEEGGKLRNEIIWIAALCLNWLRRFEG